jgi:O-antigen/teichoic acid export membrane protein
VGAAGLQFWIARDVAQRGRLTSGTVAVVVRHSLVVLAAAVLAGLISGTFLVPTVVDAETWAMTVAFAATGAVAFTWLALPNGARAMGVVSIATGTASAVYLSGALVLLALDRPSVPTIMGLAAFGNVVTVVVCTVYMLRHRDRFTTVRSEIGPTWRRGLRFGVAGGAGELVLLGMLRIDFLLVALFLPAEAVGVYAVATALTELLWVVPDGTAQIALPSVAASDGDRLPAVFRIALMATVLAGVALCLVAEPVIRLVFGPAYVGGARAVPFLTVAAVAGGTWKMLVSELSGRRSTHDRLTSVLAGSVLMVGADLWLIPVFGITGAAAGAALGYIFAAALVLRAWCRTTGHSPRVLVALRYDDLDAFRVEPHAAVQRSGVS